MFLGIAVPEKTNSQSPGNQISEFTGIINSNYGINIWNFTDYTDSNPNTIYNTLFTLC